MTERTAYLDKRTVASALKSANWSNTSIGNKALILAAIEALEPDYLARRVVDFIEKQDPFGDHFSENDINLILGVSANNE